MKLTFSKVAASATVAAALIVVAPVAAAQAYVPNDPNTITEIVTSSGPKPVSGFEPGATVTFTLVGKGISGANLATANLPVTAASVTKTADGSGVASAIVTLPENPSGTYTLAATGIRADGSNTGGGSGSGSGSGDNSNALPATGMNADSLLGIWIGGGALVLAGATVAVATQTRRNRHKA